ncbi:MAG: Hemin import ATP-binding protein HmuV [Phycisphaerae bacterium]|nr:Hemin import ATP-binding protein HmuV [Phycisphaerae bacterium]
MTNGPAIPVAADAPAFDVRGVEFAYPSHSGTDEVRVLRKVSLQALAGRLLVVIGPNGSGKTTLLRCMAGILQPAGGQILLGGASISRLPPRRLARVLGLVPQETQLAFEFTVLQVVLMGRSPHMGRFGFEGPGDLAAARDCLRLTDTLRFEDRLFDELSSGERQRVVIARALAQQPRVLLLDEPTSFLDIGHQLQIYRLLRSLAADGMTVICVSHDLSLAAQFADEIVLLADGEVVATGLAEQVLTAETIASAYGVSVDIVSHPKTGKPVILPRE